MNNKEIIKNLDSNNQLTVLNTLKYISKEGNKDVLMHVINLLKSSNDPLIKEDIINILDNLRNPDCVPFIIDAIQDKTFKSHLPVLISSCWKNSLNFEDYIESFVDVFIDGDFQLAFDALTVIDNFEQIDHQQADVCIIKLNNAIEESKEDKIPLIQELIGIIENIKNNPAI